MLTDFRPGFWCLPLGFAALLSPWFVLCSPSLEPRLDLVFGKIWSTVLAEWGDNVVVPDSGLTEVWLCKVTMFWLGRDVQGFWEKMSQKYVYFVCTIFCRWCQFSPTPYSYSYSNFFTEQMKMAALAKLSISPTPYNVCQSCQFHRPHTIFWRSCHLNIPICRGWVKSTTSAKILCGVGEIDSFIK